MNLCPEHTKKETHKNIFSQLIYWLSNTEYSIKSCTQQNTLWMLMFYPLTVELKKKKRSCSVRDWVLCLCFYPLYFTPKTFIEWPVWDIFLIFSLEIPVEWVYLMKKHFWHSCSRTPSLEEQTELGIKFMGPNMSRSKGLYPLDQEISSFLLHFKR